MIPDADTLPDDIHTLRAALAAERAARLSAEARATGAEAMIAHLKLLIAKLQRDRFGPTSERSRRLLDQLELQLEELEANAAEADAEPAALGDPRPSSSRAKSVRGPLPAHLPRERVVVPGPTVCPCCSGRLVKLGETITVSVAPAFSSDRAFEYSPLYCGGWFLRLAAVGQRPAVGHHPLDGSRESDGGQAWGTRHDPGSASARVERVGHRAPRRHRSKDRAQIY